MVRQYTNTLLEMVDNGIVDKDQLILAFCSYLSESDIKDMMESNGLIEEEDEG